jgi:L-fuculose-phosphate aldolase
VIKVGYREYKSQLIEYVNYACEDGLIRLSAGNFSLRIDNDLIAITPGGLFYRSMEEDDISIIDLEGNQIEGPRPSSETPMHTAIYRNVPRAKSICHTHSKYAMICAQLEDTIPLMSIEILVCGGPIPVAPWATPGTQKAGEVAVRIFQKQEDLQVLLLRKHGLVAIGNSLDQAYSMATNAETGMEVYFMTRLLREPHVLSPAQLKEIRKVYR